MLKIRNLNKSPGRISTYPNNQFNRVVTDDATDIKIHSRTIKKDAAEQLQKKNRFINDHNGEPIYFFRRLEKGRKCSCADGFTTPAGDCPVCFVPGTLVRTENGWKSIENIIEGEKVLSSDGQHHLVTAVFERHFEGKLSSILSTVSTNPILVTPEHPFLSLNGYESNSNFNIGKNIEIRCGRSSKNVDISRCSLDWKDASEVTKGDWLVPKWNEDIKDIEIIKIPKKFKNKFGPKVKGSFKFDVNEEFLWIVGLYLAEGSCSSRAITFSLHKKEIKYKNKIINFFKKYNYNSRVYYSSVSKGMSVEVYGSCLAKWFLSLFGNHCYTKHIPNEFMLLPNNKIKPLLKGIHRGDGWLIDNTLTITQTSEILSLQMVDLLHRLGEQPLVNRQISNFLTPKGNKRKTAYSVSWINKMNNLYKQGRNNRKGRLIFKNELLSSVRKTKKVNYSGPVYNLEVKGDHTYVVNGVVVHNCFKTGVVGGYLKYGTQQNIMEAYASDVTLINMHQSLELQLRPLNFLLDESALRGSIVFDFDILQTNHRVVDKINFLYSGTNKHASVLVYVKRPSETVYVPCTVKSVEARLDEEILNFKIDVSRSHPDVESPKISHFWLRYMILESCELPLDIAPSTRATTLDELGTIKNAQPVQAFFDNRLGIISSEDFLYRIEEREFWKPIDELRKKSVGTRTSSDVTLRVVQDFEPYAKYPL